MSAICPVFHKLFKSLVLHHDHFADFCASLLWEHAKTLDNEGFFLQKWSHLEEDPFPDEESWVRHNFWHTFKAEKICYECNGICPRVKKVIQYIPKCVSFSPGEMRHLLSHGIDINTVKGLWDKKKELYQPRLKKLIEAGVSQEAIAAAWKDRSIPRNLTRDAKEDMLKVVASMSEYFQELCDNPNRHVEISQFIYTESKRWPPRLVTSFIFWYQRKHGDVGCKNNPLGIGPMAFCDWFHELCKGHHVKAEGILKTALYWKSRNAR